MTAQCIYGTWANRVDKYVLSPDQEIDLYVGQGPEEWRRLLITSGALGEAKSAYRSEIEKRLPSDVHLSGDQFIGPAYPDEGEFDGYPVDEYGRLDFAEMVADIDVPELVDRYGPEGE